MANAGPVIIGSGDDLWLIDGEHREKRNTISAEYTVLKTVDHIPLALFVMLERRVDKPLPEDTRKALQGLLAHTNRSSSALEAAPLSPVLHARLGDMLAKSSAFIQNALSSNVVTRPQLDAFISSVREATLLNVDDAVAMEMRAIDEAVRDYRKKLTPEQWARLHVVIGSGHMPRENERRMQYFSVLFNQKREGDRVIYMEGSDNVDQALDLLATHLIDASISREYFKGDEWRMHRDLLSEAAARYLKLHPPTK